VDSRALAELLRLNSLLESYMPPPYIATLREKVRWRAFLVMERTKLKVKIKVSSHMKESSLRMSTTRTRGR
jgi:hypothetical protein